MHKLLKEFLSYIVEERVVRPVGVPWQTSKGWSAKRAAGEKARTGFRSKAAAQAWLAGTGRVPGDGASVPKGGKKGKTVVGTEPTASGTEPTPPPAPPEGTDSTTTNLSKLADTLPGGKGTLDAVVGIIEKGSAGAGSKSSRAAEASVVLVLNNLLGSRQSSDSDIDQFLSANDAEIDSLIDQLSKLKGSKLKGDWKDAVKKQVITTFSETERKFGKIQNVVWDNQEGRDSLGIKKKNRRDRSDLYLRLEDGSIIGVSLKKDGNVFLANQGYGTTIDDISSLSTSPEAKKKLQDLKDLHKTAAREQTAKLFTYVMDNNTDISNKLSELTRDQIGPDVKSDTYDFLFDESGKISQEFIGLFNAAVEKFNAGEIKSPLNVFTRQQGFGEKRFKLLMKSLATISKSSPEIEKLFLERRAVDALVTRKLINTIQTDEDVRKSVTAYMLDVLDVPQTLSTNPFDGVSKIVTVYGDGTVDDKGNNIPMFVDAAKLRQALNISPDASSKDVFKQLQERFIIDAESDSKVGLVRLRMTNPNYPPPPKYFYPTIATMGVRERGLGTAPVFELHQHDSWTATLSNGSPNPADWKPTQRKKNARETIKFLTKQLKNPLLTKKEKSEIQADIDTYKKILGNN